MKRVVIGTAGHVDHGKTSLIKAITGIDCDRLKEEKERGLTIELGFASMNLPSGERVGVVDVPGHVRFIRHMLSGASGIDLVLLVIAADEGVMPQTREHMQICELLGIERGVVALTKKDLVDDDLLELATGDVRDFIAGTFLHDAPIIPVSSATGDGIESLLAELDAQVALVHERQVTGIPVLPVDRIFTIKGFGTVVTGTLTRGTFTGDMEVEVLPAGRTARIRNLQVHDEDVNQALAGMRTAVNLQGLSTEDIERGQWVVPAGVFDATRLIDARVTLLRKPGRGGIRMYIGTAEVMGDISLHAAGGRDAARIRLKAPVVAAYGDRFILRAVSPPVTIGGGTVLNPHPARRFSEEVLEDLLSDDPARRIVGLAKDGGMHGIARRVIDAVFSDAPARTDKAIAALLSAGELVRFDAAGDLYVHGSHLEKLKAILVSRVDDYHGANPSTSGISREHLRSSVQGGVEAKLFHKVLQDLVKKGALAETGHTLSRPGFSASLAADRTGTSDRMAAMIEKAAFEPPRIAEVAEALRISPREAGEILAFLCREGRLVKIKDDIYLSRTNEEALRERVREFIGKNASMAASDMKAVIGVSRKYAIPYLEYLDRIHFTMRVGDVRKLAAAKQP
ncbi:MAG TPA: selenocysteine-specific translation elongation factor [Deltaproteobacteria bacterium]|nr:selenocysteine-specific translation elongation factor [Deltaproteobacteria bacterium]HOG85224.1 selenocysteine-specific translation elongation factor [Deltaproteobacteria bacterium]HON95080.1 selenocysteine-specific translation elongation factor [Deltaproteobacteria bacterium]HPA76304.1 selenocysteine-specific translation elongation factor [Deltaproteobacteria bacterium]HPH51504.1 selenocysteine-specific translation elongation factor [Deltaproteobacteria bacterium]